VSEDASKPGADPRDATAGETVRRLIIGFRTTQLVYVAAKLGIADLLEDGPKEASALASAVGADAGALNRLMRALASLEIFAQRPDGRFELTPLARTLRSHAPGSLRDLAMLYGDDWVWDAYGNMLHSVMTGLPAFDRVHGQTFYSYLDLHADAATAFDRGMTAYSELETAAILGAYDFGNSSNVVDVGGGQGALLMAVLKAYPRARGVLFDQETVVERARDVMVRAEVAARCTIEQGSFFDSIPVGGDVYILKSILHNWDDERSVTILKNCRGAMRPGTKLLIVERLVPEGNEPSEAKLFDINMLVVLGGLERTKKEYRAILDQAGFDIARVISTTAPVSILEAMPR